MEQRSRRKTKRLSAEDWVCAALEALGRSGCAGVAVEPLAATLGVTKGSFYSHFRDRDELLRAALGRWRDDDTARLERLMREGGSAGAALNAVLADMFDNDSAGRIFVNVCAAGADPLVAPYALDHALHKVDALTDLLRRAGRGRQDALRSAELTYTAYIGYWRIKSMFPPGDPGVLPGYLENLRKQLVPRTAG
ncbi:TetR/AcrR family transcriptional regulator [Mycolicibacterium alvei]|uniref:TetR family transcriptional regulator n=1 Tax=Mycolicibacterium alvei TaxID=67081 RepID=A0A6N4V2J8_9MYCO|nr:TetR/AcrR family transcriptional regulator [Mycolicibacterium alvei]MCV7003736.1 TetR/AcrR family transcriptional regulator [Mycolicibacterium alvei]BBX30117.1 TetR family transcriptional regulator [Mycolicibacterium alvei]